MENTTKKQALKDLKITLDITDDLYQKIKEISRPAENDPPQITEAKEGLLTIARKLSFAYMNSLCRYQYVRACIEEGEK